MKKVIPVLFAIFVAGVVTAHAASVVTVSIAPQKKIVDMITGGNVNVNVLIASGTDPHTFSPKASQMAALSKSDIYFTIGFPFEDAMLHKITSGNKNLKVVSTIKGIVPEVSDHHHDHDHDHADHKHGNDHMDHHDHTDHDHSDHDHADHDHADHDHHDHMDHHDHDHDHHDHMDHHDHDHDHDHDHAEHHHYDPHYWTDPANMLIIAENTYNALIAAYPDKKLVYTANYNKLVKSIQDVDAKFKTLFKNSKNRTFAVYHPSYKYFARTYSLNQLELERDGKAPKAKELQEILEHVSENALIAFIAQPTDNPSAVRIIEKELGKKAVIVNILNEDWFKIMDDTYKAFGGK